MYCRIGPVGLVAGTIIEQCMSCIVIDLVYCTYIGIRGNS